MSEPTQLINDDLDERVGRLDPDGFPPDETVPLGYGPDERDPSDQDRRDCRGEALARMTLYAVWTRTMRRRQDREQR